ncbi:S-layer homology domain-containing protein [Paenibacillus sp. NPDC058071]|uniref:S-layer homology domain-containing protein n=1 Tax=Paenibacillus sp. NPDC058071 TaxID=3346326 RepID=UPI0036DA44D0
MKHRSKAKTWLRKLYILSMAFFIACTCIAVTPVYAAETWSQFGRTGPVVNSNLGGFSTPKGVAVDSSGNVYVADTSNHRIQKLTLSTNTWSEWKKIGGSTGNGLGEFNGPSAVAVDSSGNVYVADSGNHRIQKLTLSTNTWSEWKKTSPGAANGLGLGEFNNPRGVAVDNSGNVYVADSNNHRIQKLTLSTNTWSEWKKSSAGAVPGNGLGEFNFPNGVAVDSSGNVYVGDTNNHRIQKLNKSTNTWSEWIKSGTGAGTSLGEFNNPRGMAVDGSGNVYVADTSNNRVQKLTVSTNTWSEWVKIGGSAGNGLGEFTSPNGVAVDSSGNVYAVDDIHRIQKRSAANNSWIQLGVTGPVNGSNPGEFTFPRAVAADSSGNVYVADTNNHRIQKLTLSTNTWSEWKKAGGGAGNGLGEFSSPYGVAVDSNGNVYVADTGNHRIQKLDISTNTWSEWKKAGGGAGNGLGEFSAPYGVAVDSSGNVYVADAGNHRIQKLTLSTNTWSEWKKSGGGIGSNLGEFSSPNGVAVDSSGNVYVADTGNHRIQKLTLSTNTWSEWKKSGGGLGSGLGEFSNPYGVAVDGSGNVYVADTSNHRIQKLTLSTNTWSEWKKSGGGLGNGLGEFSSPYKVAVDNSGNVYVADSSNHRIQKLEIAASSITDFASTAKSSTMATFNWTAASGATGMIIEQSPAGTNTWTTATTGVIATNATTALVMGLSPTTAYDFRLVVTGGANAGNSNTISVTTDAAQTYTIADIADQTATALTAGYGSGTQETKTVTITKTGTGDLTQVAAALSGTNASDFVITQPGATTLNSAITSTTFTVKAKDGLAAGTYIASVTVSADNMTNVTFTVTQTVNPAPVAPSITSQPDNKTVTAGQTATFSVTASGDAPLSYQWKKDGNALLDGGNISGATTATLSITNAQSSDAGSYTVVVTNTAGNATSNAAALTVNPAPVAPSITSQPDNKTVTVGQTATFSVTASGDAPLNYQWKKDGNALIDGGNISGATTATLGITNAQPSDAGNYTVVITNAAGDVTSNAATLTVNTLTNAATPSIGTQPADQTVNVGGSAPLSVTASVSDGGTVSYQWYSNTIHSNSGGTLINGATTATYNVPTTMAGTTYYYVVVTNTNTSVNGAKTATVVSSAAKVAVNVTPTYTIAAIANQIASPLTQGYASGTQETKTIHITKTGTGNLTNLAIALSGSQTNDFVVTQPEATTLDSGIPSTTFTVKVKDGLPAGTYTATVTVTADHMTAVTFTVTQAVNLPNVPANPQNLVAAGGDRQVTLNWNTVPGASYYNLYMSTTSGQFSNDSVATVSNSTYNVQNLTNGTAYYFIVKAGNPGGLSAESNQVSATPATIPAAPTNVTAVAGNGQATISFTAPTDNGGSAVMEYEVTISPGNTVVIGMASPITITGLTNGRSYTFTVKAINGAGSSVSSVPSNAITPAAPSSGAEPAAPARPDTGEAVDTGVDVRVNDKVKNAATATTTKQNDKTVITITVDQTKLDDMLALEGQHSVVAIQVNRKSDVVVSELNGQMIKNMENKQSVLEIKTDQATYTLPAHQINIDAIANQIGRSAALKDIRVQIEIATPAANTLKVIENEAAKGTFTLVAPAIDFTVKATYEGATVHVSKFNTYVERTIAIPDGADPNKITTGVVVESDGSIRHVPTKVVVIDGKHYAKINSLTNSTYSVVWHPLEFKDMTHHWAKAAVNDMGSRMVINGTGNGMFSPDRDMTRAELAGIIVRGLGLKPENGTSPFSDVNSSDWYSSSINTAYAYHLINGFEDGTFRPNDNVTREQAMVMIAKAMTITGLKAKLSNQLTGEILQPYTDAVDASTWALSSMADCIQAGIVSGRNGAELAPKELITRAEVAAIVQRLLQKSELI